MLAADSLPFCWAACPGWLHDGWGIRVISSTCFVLVKPQSLSRISQIIFVRIVKFKTQTQNLESRQWRLSLWLEAGSRKVRFHLPLREDRDGVEMGWYDLRSTHTQPRAPSSQDSGLKPSGCEKLLNFSTGGQGNKEKNEKFPAKLPTHPILFIPCETWKHNLRSGLESDSSPRSRAEQGLQGASPCWRGAFSPRALCRLPRPGRDAACVPALTGLSAPTPQRPAGGRSRGPAEPGPKAPPAEGEPERRARPRQRGLLLKCRAQTHFRDVPRLLGFAVSSCRWGPAGSLHTGPGLPGVCSADPAWPTAGRPGRRSSCQCRSRPRCWAAPSRSGRCVLGGPPVLLTALWTKTRRPGFAPVRTTVWSPEQGTQTNPWASVLSHWFIWPHWSWDGPEPNTLGRRSRQVGQTLQAAGPLRSV